MTTVLLTEQRGETFLICRRGRARTRLVARLRSWTLDRALANGACPDSSASLSFRAHGLISYSTRAQLARKIRLLQREAERPVAALERGVPICREKIVHGYAVLEALVSELLRPGPVGRQRRGQGETPSYRRRVPRLQPPERG